jgi:hypothetical protein
MQTSDDTADYSGWQAAEAQSVQLFSVINMQSM